MSSVSSKYMLTISRLTDPVNGTWTTDEGAPVANGVPMPVICDRWAVAKALKPHVLRWAAGGPRKQWVIAMAPGYASALSNEDTLEVCTIRVTDGKAELAF